MSPVFDGTLMQRFSEPVNTRAPYQFAISLCLVKNQMPFYFLIGEIPLIWETSVPVGTGGN